MQQWVKEKLGEAVAGECIEKVEEWHHHFGLYAKRECPAVYTKHCERNPHRSYLQVNGAAETAMQSDGKCGCSVQAISPSSW